MPPIQEIIKQLREAESKATKGEWFYDGIGYLFSGTPGNVQMVADDGNGEETRMRGVGANLPLKDNASLIVLMRNNLIPLLDRIEELETSHEGEIKLVDKGNKLVVDISPFKDKAEIMVDVMEFLKAKLDQQVYAKPTKNAHRKSDV